MYHYTVYSKIYSNTHRGRWGLVMAFLRDILELPNMIQKSIRGFLWIPLEHDNGRPVTAAQSQESSSNRGVDHSQSECSGESIITSANHGRASDPPSMVSPTKSARKKQAGKKREHKRDVLKESVKRLTCPFMRTPTLQQLIKMKAHQCIDLITRATLNQIVILHTMSTHPVTVVYLICSHLRCGTVHWTQIKILLLVIKIVLMTWCHRWYFSNRSWSLHA